ncbi:MAG: condensation domain-containing protein, partial [Chitinophagaceae bacterium]
MKDDLLNKVRTFRTAKELIYLLNPNEKNSATVKVCLPSNEDESTLYAIWKNLLGHDNFGVKDDFFQVGGNSLKAVQLISRISRDFAGQIQLTEVFLQPTIEQLTRHILAQKKVGVSISIFGSQPRPEHIPLSFSQERLWFIDQLEGSLQYHVPSVWRLQGELNKEALANSLQYIINRHEVLRTVILEEEGQAYQSVMGTEGWQLAMIDGLLYREDKDKLQKYIQDSIREPFDLSKDYMMRASLITLSDEEHVLVITLHHISTDAWSMPIIVGEITELYTAYLEDRPAQLTPLEIQYSDYALWQRNHLQGVVLDRKIEYWKNKLEDIVTLHLPTDYIRPPVKGVHGAEVKFIIEKELSDQIHMLCQQEGTTLFMTLLAAFKVLLNRYSGQEDICVGTSIANRGQQEVEELIGFFVNTLALRSEVKSGEAFTKLLQQVKATTIEAYNQQDLSFEKVVEVVLNERDLSRNPLFQVMLVMQNIPKVQALRLGEMELSIEELSQDKAKFDITFFINEISSGLQGRVEYSTDLYNAATVNRMVCHFKELLSSIVKNPQQKVCELAILTEGEEQQLLVEFNDAKVNYPREKTINILFQEQAEKTPDSIAIVYEAEQLTYKELNERANQLARYLKKRGIKEQTLIPICVERGLEMIVAILGILKAGGAYVPIDTDLPEERMAYMLENTVANIAITNKESKRKLLVSTEIEIIDIDDDWAAISTQPTDNLQTDVQPHHLAYVIYTSGSTGNPKGVMIEHRSIVDYVFGLNQKTQIDQCES